MEAASATPRGCRDLCPGFGSQTPSPGGNQAPPSREISSGTQLEGDSRGSRQSGPSCRLLAGLSLQGLQVAWEHVPSARGQKALRALVRATRGGGGDWEANGGKGKPGEVHAGGEMGRSEGAPPNSDPHRPWRRNLRFLRPKMRTLEKISTRLPLQSPRFLLGLLRLLLADGRSQCCSRACRFWRIKPLAMAAAMVAWGWVRVRWRTEGRGAGGTGEGRGGADPGSPSGRRLGDAGGVGERRRGAQSRLGPMVLSTRSRGQVRRCALGAAGRALGARGPSAGSWPRWSWEGVWGCGRRGHHTTLEPSRGPPPPLALPFCPAHLLGRRWDSPPSSRALDGGRSRPGPGESVRSVRVEWDSASGWSCPASGAAAGAAAAARSGVLPVIVKCFENQHLEKAIFSLEIAHQSASLPSTTPTSRPPPLFRKKKKVCI